MSKTSACGRSVEELTNVLKIKGEALREVTKKMKNKDNEIMGLRAQIIKLERELNYANRRIEVLNAIHNKGRKQD